MITVRGRVESLDPFVIVALVVDENADVVVLSTMLTVLLESDVRDER